MQVRPEKQDNSCIRHSKPTAGELGKPVCHLVVSQEGFVFSLGMLKEGAPSLMLTLQTGRMCTACEW